MRHFRYYNFLRVHCLYQSLMDHTPLPPNTMLIYFVQKWCKYTETVLWRSNNIVLGGEGGMSAKYYVFGRMSQLFCTIHISFGHIRASYVQHQILSVVKHNLHVKTHFWVHTILWLITLHTTVKELLSLFFGLVIMLFLC